MYVKTINVVFYYFVYYFCCKTICNNAVYKKVLSIFLGFQAIILEGKYWKRNIEAVAAEYKRWRVFYKNQYSKSTFEPFSFDFVSKNIRQNF